MLGKRYLLDREKLTYKEHKYSFWQKIYRFSIFLTLSLVLAIGYGILFKHFFGAPKENRLQSELDHLVLQYRLLKKDFNSLESELADIARVENNIYRPILSLEQIPSSFRQSGFGGNKKYSQFEGYLNSDLMISAQKKTDELLRKTYIQSRSFEEIIPVASDWKNKIEHIPYIRPVNVNIPLGEGIKYRDHHPVLGKPRWHYGQDFSAPPGTEVFAAGKGKVARAGWSPYGFGNMVEIDHGYGFKTIYGHLSDVNVTVGQEVVRGQIIGLSGSTGISSGPHLHYEIHYNGRVQNPLYFFDDDLTMVEYNKMINAYQSGEGS